MELRICVRAAVEKSMASLSTPPKRRRRAQPRSPNPSSSSILTSLEPSSTLLPSKKSEFIKLLGVVTIASFVAFSSNYLINFFNNHSTPFCDMDLSLSPSGHYLFFLLYFYFKILYFCNGLELKNKFIQY